MVIPYNYFSLKIHLFDLQKKNLYPISRGKRDNGEESILANFLCMKRKKYESLSEKEIAKLESLEGFKWNAGSEYRFSDRIEHIKLFVEKYDSFPKSTGKREENENLLSDFIVKYRTQKRKKTLSEEMIKAFESIIGFDWNPRKTKKKE